MTTSPLIINDLELGEIDVNDDEAVQKRLIHCQLNKLKTTDSVDIRNTIKVSSYQGLLLTIATRLICQYDTVYLNEDFINLANYKLIIPSTPKYHT
jgi:hypothetical protein